MKGSQEAAQSESVFVTAPDGLKLHVRCYGSQHAPRLPVVCLPGLTRTTADFHELATALASDSEAPRRVLSLDYRGRGLSDYDPSPANYNLAVELKDLQTVLDGVGIKRAVFIGTSRGGLLTMLLAMVRPASIAGAVLNDIGPVIEPAGLARIKSYVGKMRQPVSFEHAGDLLRELFDAQFPKLTARDWLASAHASFKLEHGQFVPTHDVALAKNLGDLDLSKPQPHLWDAFAALASVPLLAVRGANTDLLSEQTMTEMQARHPGMHRIDVPEQGHPPILSGTELLQRLADFVEECEKAAA
jgi:pimeloyl-ACP methyl ester carboxylesterase